MSSNDNKDLSVIPVVGLGGLGKTTLTKLVYNDHSVVENFELRTWVCVSEEFDLKKLVEKILKSATGWDYSHLDMDQLQNCLRYNISTNKKFLLVLDDVWNDDPKKWAELKDLLIDGAEGSIVFVTTRNMRVASFMGTVTPYKLSVLPNDECLSLFIKCAFKEGKEKEHPELLHIGRAIVRKCGGIPLAVRTLGSLLYMKTEEREWLYIRDNEIWRIEQEGNDILPILRLSYDQMPYDLKRCFAYCSILPKDYEITKKELVTLWKAQGLVSSPDGNLEDIGNRYFNELISRSFLQDVVRHFDFDIWKCKMHDLVHDLAQSVAGTECLILSPGTNTIISEQVRHVSFYDSHLSTKDFPRSLLKADKLRSFWLSYKVGVVNKSFLKTLVEKFRCLRSLALSGSEFKELPSSIGDLNNLRYINLDYNRKLKALPNSFCKLLNLQMLNLLGCENLQGLPRDIGKLISLEGLYLTSQLISLPENGLRGLTSLQTLHLFRCRYLTSLSEGIQYLTALQTFRLIECPRLISLPQTMKHVTTLKKLVIQGCEELNLSEGEALHGLQTLRSTVIGSLPKLEGLPHGFQLAKATLRHLCIEGCTSLTDLPEWLSNMTSLQGLSIVGCPNLSSLPGGLDCLITVRVLNIKGCPHLTRRCRKT